MAEIAAIPTGKFLESAAVRSPVRIALLAATLAIGLARSVAADAEIVTSHSTFSSHPATLGQQPAQSPQDRDVGTTVYAPIGDGWG